MTLQISVHYYLAARDEFIERDKYATDKCPRCHNSLPLAERIHFMSIAESTL